MDTSVKIYSLHRARGIADIQVIVFKHSETQKLYVEVWGIGDEPADLSALTVKNCLWLARALRRAAKFMEERKGERRQ